MGSINSATISGNLGSDPTYKVTKGGTSMLEMTVAVDESYVDREGNRKSETSWIRVIVWGNRAKGLSGFLKKGMKVAVHGRLKQRSWRDELDRAHSIVEIVADDIDVATSRSV